jgi:hypothetical protein
VIILEAMPALKVALSGFPAILTPVPHGWPTRNARRRIAQRIMDTYDVDPFSGR